MRKRIAYRHDYIEESEKLIASLNKELETMKRTPFSYAGFNRKFRKYFSFQKICQNSFAFGKKNFHGVVVEIRETPFYRYFFIRGNNIILEIPVTTNRDLIEKLLIYKMLTCPIGYVW